MNTKAQFLDAKARQLAKTLLLTEGEVLATLMEMSRERVFAELNYAGIFDYCQKALGFSEAQCFHFQKVAQVSVAVPQLKEAVVRGELSVSKARRIAPVITKNNQAEWISKAKCMKQKELEKAVTEVNPQARPIERIKPVAKNLSKLEVLIDDQGEEDLTVLLELLSQKLKRAATKGGVIAWALKEAREKHDPERKAQRARKLSLGKPTPVANPGRHPIPASVRHEVVRQQGAQCSFVSTDNRRCEQRRWLDLHHINPVAKGGLNQVENLSFYCSGHHRTLHAPLDLRRRS